MRRRNGLHRGSRSLALERPGAVERVRELGAQAIAAQGVRALRNGIHSFAKRRGLGCRAAVAQYEATDEQPATPVAPDPLPTPSPPPRSRAEIQRLLDKGLISLDSREGAMGMDGATDGFPPPMEL